MGLYHNTAITLELYAVYRPVISDKWGTVTFSDSIGLYMTQGLGDNVLFGGKFSFKLLHDWPK